MRAEETVDCKPCYKGLQIHDPTAKSERVPMKANVGLTNGWAHQRHAL